MHAQRRRRGDPGRHRSAVDLEAGGCGPRSWPSCPRRWSARRRSSGRSAGTPARSAPRRRRRGDITVSLALAVSVTDQWPLSRPASAATATRSAGWEGRRRTASRRRPSGSGGRSRRTRCRPPHRPAGGRRVGEQSGSADRRPPASTTRSAVAPTVVGHDAGDVGDPARRRGSTSRPRTATPRLIVTPGSAAASVARLRSRAAAGHDLEPLVPAPSGDRSPVMEIEPYPPSGHGSTHQDVPRCAGGASTGAPSGPRNGTPCVTAPTGAAGTGHVRTTVAWRPRSSTSSTARPIGDDRPSDVARAVGGVAAATRRTGPRRRRPARRRRRGRRHAGRGVVDPATATGPIRIRRSPWRARSPGPRRLTGRRFSSRGRWRCRPGRS